MALFFSYCESQIGLSGDGKVCLKRRDIYEQGGKRGGVDMYPQSSSHESFLFPQLRGSEAEKGKQ